MTKTELEAEVKRLENLVALCQQDEQDANQYAWKLEHRHILVKIKRDGLLLDAVVIPPNGSMSSPIVAHPDDDYLDNFTELWTEPIE